MFIFSGFAHSSVKADGWLAGCQPGGRFGRFLPLKAGATPHHQPGVEEEASPKSYLPALGMGERVLIGAPHFTRKMSGPANIPTAEFVYLKDEVVNQEWLALDESIWELDFVNLSVLDYFPTRSLFNLQQVQTGLGSR